MLDVDVLSRPSGKRVNSLGPTCLTGRHACMEQVVSDLQNIFYLHSSSSRCRVAVSNFLCLSVQSLSSNCRVVPVEVAWPHRWVRYSVSWLVLIFVAPSIPAEPLQCTSPEQQNFSQTELTEYGNNRAPNQAQPCPVLLHKFHSQAAWPF